MVLFRFRVRMKSKQNDNCFSTEPSEIEARSRLRRMKSNFHKMLRKCSAFFIQSPLFHASFFVPCVSRIWTIVTWLWWFGFRLGQYQIMTRPPKSCCSCQKRHKNNHLTTFTKILFTKIPDIHAV